MSDTVTACPYCDSHRIAVNSGSSMSSPKDVPPFRCRTCCEGFDEPNRRPPKNNPNSRKPNGLPRKLLEADPDEVSG